MEANATPDEARKETLNFIETIIANDLEAGVNQGRVITRFPPEPNGYLHIGHAKSILLNFGVAARFGGQCNLRFDDTNPTKEEVEYVDAIENDLRWLGCEWAGETRYASDYFGDLFSMAETLIEKGVAYVDDLDVETMRAQRGSATTAGTDSPNRDRSAEENLDLFRRMRAGEFEEGACCLRAKIDMAHKNLLLRDPVLYRILKTDHHRTGSRWCVYPTYDFAHGQSDALEGVTHSICTLEFVNHRPLYDWCLDHIDLEGRKLATRPQQYEFARLALTYTVMSKRKLLRLVEEGRVSGWDDPRMPTISGMRRRGYPAAAIRTFCEKIGVTKANSMSDFSLLESCLRDNLNLAAPRRLGVLDPVKLIIENYPEGESEEFDAVNNPQDESAGTRKVPFSREVWVEKGDFRAVAPRKWHRLAPGKEIRLRYACYITVTGFETDPDTDEVSLIRATYDPESRGGNTPDERKVRGTIHWVSVAHAFEAEVRIYDHLFSKPEPEKVEEGEDYLINLNPNSLKVLKGVKLEPALRDAEPGSVLQFERNGYFCVDVKDSAAGALVFNRTVAMRDSWAKKEGKG